MTTILVLGAGGSDGGQFIDGALAELRALTGFAPEHASAVIGTSIGAFRAASVGPVTSAPPGVSEAIRSLSRQRPDSRPLDRSARRLRLLLGRLVARLVPRRRPAATWSVPGGPYHHRAVAVSVDLDVRRRATHPLAAAQDATAAVRASAAVPFAVAPVQVAGAAHADGAIWSPTNADLATTGLTSPDQGEGVEVETVVVIAPMVPRDGGSPLAHLHRRQLRSELARLPATTSVLVVCPAPGRRDQTRTRAAGVAAVRALRTNGSV